MAVFAEDPESGDPADALEDLAVMLLSWAASIRAENQKLKRDHVFQIGQKIRVRLPDHFPLFIAEIVSPEEVYVPVLDKSYPMTEIRIVPENTSPRISNPDAVVMQEELEKRLEAFGAKKKDEAPIIVSKS